MEHKENKPYTKNGDKGLTSLLPGSQVSKADERVGAMGGVEELISALGLVRTVTACPIFCGKLERIQRTLRTMSSGLADPRSGRFMFSTEEIAFLESDMDQMQSQFADGAPADSMQNLPGGCEQSARLDMARSVSRRAERALIAMDRRYAVPETFKQYMNRLGDYLLVAARYADWLDARRTEASASSVAADMNFGEPATATTGHVPVMGANLDTAAAGTVPAMEKPMEQVIAEVVARLGGPQVLNLDTAVKLIAAVEAKAASEGKRAVISVVNAEGNPIAVHVMDGAFLVSYEVAVKKAYTAVAVKMPTAELAKFCQPGQTFYGLQSLDKIVIFGGGVPLMRGGAIIGGLGVSGGTGEEDDALAAYGAAVFSALVP